MPTSSCWESCLNSSTRRLPAALLCVCSLAGVVRGEDPLVIEDAMVHLRSGQDREWATFPEQCQAASLVRSFDAKANANPWTLSIRQQDVKQSWEVRLNDMRLGRLVRDENDLRTDIEIPAGGVVAGQNQLEIRHSGRGDSDDIRIGQVTLHRVPPGRLRNLATAEVVLVDSSDMPIPGRVTIVQGAGTLTPIGASSGNGLAVREGVVYTATGKATFGLRPDVYRVYGSRGLEYSMAWARFEVNEGERVKRTLQLERVLDTSGWVACDTHVHTVTHSGHGDCTIEERMVTLVGEGIELPIATDHNKHIDYRPAARQAGVHGQFTPVIGNEVTTKNGHFNIFPVQAGAETPDHSQLDWQPLLDDIFATPHVRVAILNHPRDVHAGFRPFSPRHHISLTGENLDGWPLLFNAMEVINSGAVQSDSMELFRDWCGLVNRGLQVTPIGSSDSHDVARYIVGQGRTYIRCDDTDVGAIDVDEAVDALLESRVVVSYGLFADLLVNGKHRAGDLVALAEDEDQLVLEIDVQGPPFTRANWVEAYVNGGKRFSQQILFGNLLAESPQKARMVWRMDRSELQHDVWIAAVARGPGVESPFWKTAKPYQPDSAIFTPTTFSSTGAIWIDVDGDGKFSSPRDYAERIIAEDQDPQRLTERLGEFHASVTHQAMSLLRERSIDLAPFQQAAGGDVRGAIADYQRAWRRSIAARAERVE